jgi:hypothetical protein
VLKIRLGEIPKRESLALALKVLFISEVGGGNLPPYPFGSQIYMEVVL